MSSSDKKVYGLCPYGAKISLLYEGYKMEKLLKAGLILMGAMAFTLTLANATCGSGKEAPKTMKYESGKCSAGKCGKDGMKDAMKKNAMKKESNTTESAPTKTAPKKGKCGVGKCG